MTLLIITIGSLILFAGVLLLINPEIIFGFLRNNSEKSAIQVIAVLARLIIGILLITQSSQSRFPLAIELLGWVFIVAGVSLAVIGRTKFRTLITWVVTNLRAYAPIAAVIALAFGGFLVYAFV